MYSQLILFLIFSMQLFHEASGQVVCIDTTLSKSFYLQNRNLNAYERIACQDNGTLVTVNVMPSFPIEAGIVKVTYNGNIAWSKIFNPINANQLFRIYRTLQLQDGNFIIGGVLYYDDASAPSFALLIKLDNQGNVIWQKKYKNNYGSTTADDVWVRNVQEGINGDIIIMLEENLKKSISRLNSQGQIIWSNMYFGALLVPAAAGILNKDNHLSFWSVAYSAATGTCFKNNEQLINVTLDYSSGAIISNKIFCIKPGLKPLHLGVFNEPEKSVASIKLSNGNTLFFIFYYGVERSMLINLFDPDMNFLKSSLFSLPENIPSFPRPNYFFDANKKSGEVILNFYLRTPLPNEYILPFNFFLFLDSNLNLKKELFVQNFVPDTLIGEAKFLPTGQINFTTGSRQVNNPQYYQVTYSNTIAGGEADAFCNAKDSLFGKLEPHGLIYNGNNFNFDSIRSNVYSFDADIALNTSSFNILQTTTCNIISVCDSLKITGLQNICLSKDTIKYQVYKNPQCLKKINWSVDTAYATIINLGADNTLSIVLKRTGSFKLIASLEGCIIKDSLSVNISSPKTFFEITEDTLICPGGSLTLQASKGFAQYQWQNGAITDSLIVTSPGFFKVNAIDGCGNIFKDSIIVKQTNTNLNITSKESICLTDVLSFKTPGSIENIVWSPIDHVSFQNNTLNFFPVQTTLFKLGFTLTPGCKVEKELLINVKNCPETIFFPNSFTPNNDGSNDLFKPTVSRPLSFYKFQVYNRYGQKVFETSSTQKGWDGTVGGMNQNTGTFIWQCSYQFNNKALKTEKGSVLLLR